MSREKVNPPDVATREHRTNRRDLLKRALIVLGAGVILQPRGGAFGQVPSEKPATKQMSAPKREMSAPKRQMSAPKREMSAPKREGGTKKNDKGSKLAQQQGQQPPK